MWLLKRHPFEQPRQAFGSFAESIREELIGTGVTDSEFHANAGMCHSAVS